MSWLVDTLTGRRSAEDPQYPLTSKKLLEFLNVPSGSDAGVVVTPATAMRFTAVYRAIAMLSGLVGGLPLKAYRPVPGGGAERVDSPVIGSPHVDKTPLEVWEFVGMSLFSHGNAFDLKLRDRLGRIRELEPVHAKDTTVRKRREWVTPENPTGKRFEVVDGATTRWFTPFEMLHIPGLSYDGLVGMSPIGLARQGIGLALAAEQFGARMFARGALIQGVLKSKNKLDEDASGRLKRQWAAKTSGADHQWQIPVLDSDTDFQRIALPPAEAQYIESRKFSVTDIARLYGLPPHLLADVERSTSWGSGIEQQNMQMLTFTFDPWLVRIEHRITKELLPAGTYARFTRAGLLRADTSTRYLAYQRAVNNGWMNADEVRDLEELGPIPGGAGQQFFRPGNLTPLDASEEDPNAA